jgi:Kef-type K+ transport system membrane component KefB
MDIIFSAPICLLFFFTVGIIFRKLGISGVVGMIIAGIVLSSSPIGDVLIKPNSEAVSFLGELGLFSIMFMAGLEVSWSMLYTEKRDAVQLAVLASVTPFLLAFSVFMLLGFPLVVSLFVGVCMSITAEATKARVLLEVRKLKTRIGTLMMGAGIIDDLIGMGLFIALAYAFHTELPTKEVILLSGVVLSFFLGVFVHREVGRAEKMVPHVEKALAYLLVPFFFLSMGSDFSMASLIIDPLLLVIIVSVAILGKMLGTALTKPLTKLSAGQLYLVGWGMNSRGAVELALAFIAFSAGLIPVDIYSALIVMAMVTTMAFPLFFTRMVKGNPKIMD